MTKEIHIAAVAARTPVGLRAEASAAAVRAKIQRIREHPFLVDAQGEPLYCAFDSVLPSTLLGIARCAALLGAVFEELVEKLPAVSALPGSIPCWLCLPEPRPGFGRGEQAGLERAIGEQHRDSHALFGRLTLRTLALGHAGGVAALELAVREIATGQAQLCLVAGVDSYLEADTLDWLERWRAVARKDIRGGFQPGEGAAMIALCSDALRRRLHLSSLASVAATAQAQETALEFSDAGLQGRALSDTYLSVGEALRGGRFDDVYIDINNERGRTTDYAFALLRAGQLFRDGSSYETCIGSTGELGAAFSVFNMVLAVRAFARNYARGDHALISSASWNGLRGSVLLRRGKP